MTPPLLLFQRTIRAMRVHAIARPNPIMSAHHNGFVRAGAE
jgi:hypothetical protein